MGPRSIGLGCMRLSTRADRDDARSVEVITAALDAGATLLDTSNAYCLDETDTGHNERLIARALRVWTGDASRVTVATKGGLVRPGGRWRPDGRASQLRAACDASRRALGVDVIDLYQLHAPDPRVPLETSVRALAALRDEGRIRDIGLCNVNVGQIDAARSVTDIAAVQVSISPLDDENLRNGVAEYCRDHGLRLIAARPLGGGRLRRITNDVALRRVAERHGVTPEEAALAWLLDLGALPIPGATRVATAASLARVLAIEWTDADRALLDEHFPAGRLLRVPRSRRMPAPGAAGVVVLIMGPPAAGKTGIAKQLVVQGYERLNRDERGGRVSDLLPELERGLAAGRRRWVLDNTYPGRSARNDVIECAWRHGVPVRCIHLETPIAEAQINAVARLIETHGRLPMPDELKTIGRRDHRYFGPDAQFRWERQLERPVAGEGFVMIESRAFERRASSASGRAVFLELDQVLCASARDAAMPALDPDDVRLLPGRRDGLECYVEEGWRLFAVAWRPQLEARPEMLPAVEACYERVRSLLGLEIGIDHCPHAAGPPVCWCRKPMPGLILQFALRHDIRLDASILVGRSPADQTLAMRLGMVFRESKGFFESENRDERDAIAPAG